MKKYSIIWSSYAHQALRKIHKFVQKKSPSGANKVTLKIFETAQNLQHFPNGHPVDTRLVDQDIVYRIISTWSYQIIFTVDEVKQQVIIIHVFDSRQDPGKFNIEE